MCICGFVFILVSCFGMCFLLVVAIKFSFVVFCFACFCVCVFLIFFLLKLPAWGSFVFTRKRYNRNAHDQIAKGYVENSTENILQKSQQCKQCQNKNRLGYTTIFSYCSRSNSIANLKFYLNTNAKLPFLLTQQITIANLYFYLDKKNFPFC